MKYEWLKTNYYHNFFDFQSFLACNYCDSKKYLTSHNQTDHSLDIFQSIKIIIAFCLHLFSPKAIIYLI
jgi:hypothetical protein